MTWLSPFIILIVQNIFNLWLFLNMQCSLPVSPLCIQYFCLYSLLCTSLHFCEAPGFWTLFYILSHCRYKNILFSCLAGTFLGNNEGERRAMKAPERTASLWSYINRHEVLPKYLNPMYEPNQRVIWPSVAPMSLVRKDWTLRGNKLCISQSLVTILSPLIHKSSLSCVVWCWWLLLYKQLLFI